MRKILLTVAIPTFNRKDNLLHLLRQLLPQIRGGVRVLILDNHSEEPVAGYLEAPLAEYPLAEVKVIRNAYNVGANANILRCFELCESEWIWVVGDDDELEPAAIDTILNTIERHPDSLLLNFPIDRRRPAPRMATGLREFTEALDRSADLPWITSTVYRNPELLPNLRFGYQYAFSMLPHVAMLLVSFREEHRAYFSEIHIASRERAGAATDEQTPIINMALGFPVLLDLPIGLDSKRALVRKLLVTHDSPGLPLRQLAFQLLLLSDRREARYYFDQACGRRFYFDISLRERLEVFAYRALLMLPPQITSAAYALAKGRPLTRQVRQDRVARL